MRTLWSGSSVFLVGLSLAAPVLAQSRGGGGKPATPPAPQPFVVEVTASTLNVRATANGTYLGYVARGTRFVVGKEQGGWYRIDWQGRQAWIAARHARKHQPTSGVAAVVVNVTTLNVRAGASTGWSVLGSVRKDQTYVRLAKQGNWYKIQFDRRTGWVAGWLVRTTTIKPTPPPAGGGTTRPPRPRFRNPPMQATQAELEVLARICKGEAGVASFEGKVAVVAVVLNRVRSRRFPNTITRVAHQPWQFSCYNPNVRNRLYWGPIPRSCWDAAREALRGRDPSRGADHYYNPYLVAPAWARRMTFLIRIGTNRTNTHDFYKQ